MRSSASRLPSIAMTFGGGAAAGWELGACAAASCRAAARSTIDRRIVITTSLVVFIEALLYLSVRKTAPAIISEHAKCARYFLIPNCWCRIGPSFRVSRQSASVKRRVIDDDWQQR